MVEGVECLYGRKGKGNGIWIISRTITTLILMIIINISVNRFNNMVIMLNKTLMIIIIIKY